MKKYYLKLTNLDFSKSGNTWTSPVYDLYENSSYTNYSTIKSRYGPDVLGNKTWVGLEYDYSTNTSETGKVVGGRYIDKSGRIDIASYDLTINSVLGQASSIGYKLNLYTATENDAATPHQWTAYLDRARSINRADVFQYAYFEIVFDTDQDMSTAEFVVDIGVNIDKPLSAPLYAAARAIMQKFPSWTAIWEDHKEPATPFSATPNSLGGQFINAVAGEWFDRIESDIERFRFNQAVTTADPSLVYEIYELRVPGIDRVCEVIGDGVTLSNSYDIDDFYALDSTENGYYIPSTYENVIYLRKNYSSFYVNGETQYDSEAASPIDFVLNRTPVWNWFDEAGSRVDLFRLPQENNEIFRKRILDVYRNRPGVSKVAFQKAIRRELDLWQSEGATPDSNYLGATPEVYGISELEDLVEGASPYMNYDGIPKDIFKELVRRLNKKYPTTWGNFKWDEAIWDPGGIEAEGYSSLPYRFDATPIPEEYFGAGIGDADDLYVLRPDERFDVEEFDLSFTARGHYRTLQTQYPDVLVELTITGQGDYTAYDNPEVAQWLCVKVTHSGTDYYHNIEASATSSINAAAFTNTVKTFRIFNASGKTLNEKIWYDSAGNSYSGNAATPFQLDSSNVTAMELIAGRWDPNLATPAIVDVPTSNNFRAWWSENVGINNYPVGSSSSFDGTDDAITIADGLGNFPVTVGTNTYVSSWIVFEADDISTTPRIMAAKNGTALLDSGWELRITPSGSIRAAIGDGSNSVTVISSKTIEVGQKYLAVMVIDGSAGNQKAYLYVDNYVDNSDISTLTTINSGLGNVVYGAGQTGAASFASYFDGTIYASGTADRVLTQDEIWGLAAYYGVGHGSSEEAYSVFQDCEVLLRNYDLSGNDDNGNVITKYSSPVDNADETVPDPDAMMEYDGVSSTPNLAAVGPISATPVYPHVVFEPLTASGTSGSAWSSDPFAIEISINDGRPSTSQFDKVVNFINPFTAQIDKLLDQVPNKVINIEFATAKSVGINDESVTLTNLDIYIDGSNAWISDGATPSSYYQDLVSTTNSITVSSDYSINATVWNSFESTASNFISGVVDKHGPWRNNIYPGVGNSNYILQNVNINRSDFGVPDSADYIVRWIGVTAANKRINTWLETNSVKPAVDEGSVTLTYPNNAIVEVESGGTYSYDLFPVSVRMKLGPDKKWNPAINSGYFYTEDEEYYLYADEQYETATPSSDTFVMADVARQGAPIIVRTQSATPYPLRQTAFWDDATPSLVSYNTETVKGSGTNILFAAYDDIYDVSVKNLTTGAVVVADSASSTNQIGTSVVTSRSQDYELIYRVKNSFYVDNDYDYDDGTKRSKIVFDQSATDLGVSNYEIYYEGNVYNSATPVDLPLHPFYTTLSEGFLFISYNEYNLADSIEIRFSPSSIVANGEDFIMMSFKTYDTYGNPKPNQTFNLTTDFGTIGNEATPTSSTSITTDRDGFASVPISAAASSLSVVGAVTITGAISATVNFDIVSSTPPRPEVDAMPSVDRLPADGKSRLWVYGKYTDVDKSGIDAATINWRKGRSVYDMFDLARSSSAATPGYDGLAGAVVTDSSGNFRVGPFIAATPNDPGHWFVAVEGTYVESATPRYAGDVVFWQEYPELTETVDAFSGIPKSSVQDRADWWLIPNYSDDNAYPLYYDEATPQATPNSIFLNWEPPEWYGVPKYRQYQLGWLGTDYYEYDYQTAQDNERPDYKDR
jgi:hypothetical protein